MAVSTFACHRHQDHASRSAHVQVGQLLLHVFYIAWARCASFHHLDDIASFKPFKELMSTRDLLPHTWTLAAYQTIIQRVNFLAGFANSLLLAVTVTVAAVLTSAAVGFIFPNTGSRAGRRSSWCCWLR